MKRASGALAILFLLLGSIAFSSRSVQSADKKAATGAELRRVGRVSSLLKPPSLTIIFRGLMIFHPDPGGEFLEVGILEAPQHQFTIRLLERSGDGLSNSRILSGDLIESKSDVWSIAFPRSASNVRFYKGEHFDRTSGKGDPKDYRWLVDLESAEFHGRKLSIDKEHLKLTLHVKGGEFYTKATTLPLTRRQGYGAFEYFGRGAHEIATDVVLDDGDMVLFSDTSVKELLRLKPSLNTTYELVFENLPEPNHRFAMNFDHFQYFYRLFPIPRAERYEFRVASRDNPDALNIIKAGFSAPGSPTIPCMGAGYGGGGG